MNTTNVREAAERAARESRSFLSRQVDERTTIVGQQIETVAQQVRTVGDQLRQSGTPSTIAAYVDQGATLLDRWGRYLESTDGERMMSDLEDVARRQPWAIAAGAAALGFAASRLLKSSSSRRYYSSKSNSDDTNYRSDGGRYAS